MKHALAFFPVLFFLISPAILQAQEPPEAVAYMTTKVLNPLRTKVR